MKKLLKRILRFFGLMLLADKLRFILVKLQNNKSNSEFKKAYPDVVLPPDYLMYESFQLDYKRYFVNGEKTARWLIDLVKPFMNFERADILDWGCGPGRIIRHIPNLVPEAKSYSGSDYNANSIQWCSEYLSGISFSKNELSPPLPFEAESFNWIYGISIFTHLSEPAHISWLTELHRVLKPQGLLFLTLHGDVFKQKLDGGELLAYEQNCLVTRGQVKEGHRTFIAFHPPAYVKVWAENFEILRHIPGKSIEGSLEQDVWILKKT